MPGGIAHDEDDLLAELPPLDGEGEEGNPSAFDEPLDDLRPDGGNALDDTTGDDEPIDEPLDTLGGGDEAGEDDDDEGPLEIDLGTAIDEPVGSFLGDDEPPGVDGEDFGLGDTPDTADDAGEEGFEAEDEALRAEDLPSLDADDEGEGEDALFYEGIVRAGDSEIPWDDRGWERVALEHLGQVVAIEVQGAIDVTLKDGRTLRSVDGVTFAVFDAPAPSIPLGVPAPRASVRSLPASATAHAGLPDGSAAVAMTTLDGRSTLAIAERDGKVRIVADVTAELDLDAEDARVDALAFDPQRAILWVGGPFGLLGFRARPR
jgi:hypothetical protein